MYIRLIYRSFLLVMLSGIVSCKAYTPVATNTGSYKPLEDYIIKYSMLAVSEMKRTGIPASITLAQGMVESDYGRSYLAREANNHFGIKCHSSWKGEVSRYNDNKRNECFRKYSDAEESFHDHSEFLRTSSRYRFLFEYDPSDYRAWAKGLIRAGYATNPDYASMLIRKIEENNLWQYDDVKMSRTSPPVAATVPSGNDASVQILKNDGTQLVPKEAGNSVLARPVRIMENNRIQYIIVKDGDTKAKLEKELNLLRWELSKYNDLEADFSPVPGQLLYLQPKRDKAEVGNDYHKALEGDSMYLISQKYGIKLKSLYEMNRMSPGTEPEPGSRLWLRGMKPVN